LIKAYVKNGEGLDRAGGFAVQGLGGFLVKSIQGDYNNVVGFPTAAFWRWMGELYEDGVFND
jgi:septum formation protein